MKLLAILLGLVIGPIAQSGVQTGGGSSINVTTEAMNEIERILYHHGAIHIDRSPEPLRLESAHVDHEGRREFRLERDIRIKEVRR